MIQKTTKKIHKEWEQRRFKQLGRGYGDKVWVSKEDLVKEINDIYERYIMKVQYDERDEPVKTTLGLFVASINHPISSMKAELLEKLKGEKND